MDVATIVGIVLSVVALIFAYFKIDHEGYFGRKTISSRKAKALVNELAQSLSRQGRTKVDFIVCFPDGGLSVADLYSFAAGSRIKTISLILEALTPVSGIRKVVVDKSFLKPRCLDGNGTILVVDDATRSGVTLAAVVDYLVNDLGVKPERVYTAVLAKLKASGGFQPDWSGCSFTNTVKFPWGITPSG